MPKLDGMELLHRVVEMDRSLPVVLITAHGTVDTAVTALKTGAFDYITKPFDQAEVRNVVRKALRAHDLAESEATVGEADGDAARFGIIGKSPAILALYAVVERVAATPTTVLITGESGTGKELVARALHENSPRADKPFIKVNCAAIPSELVESELFGYERGAFTGAVGSKPGRFELAHTGTLFLDEVSSIPIQMQVKLLRAVQESEFERVGGVKTIRVDARVVAATNSDLKKEIAAGSFREDLYYRLNVVPIRLPPLRERAEDIPFLIRHFTSKFNQRLDKQISGVRDDALRLLEGYRWPGNIRELENVMERAVLFCDGDRVSAADLPAELRERARAESAPPSAAPSAASSSEGLKEQVKAAMTRLEKELIVRALRQTSGNVTHAARLLKISRKGLQLKMKELGLRERDDRPEP
jgi:DNA-binding NtrC family response regulator